MSFSTPFLTVLAIAFLASPVFSANLPSSYWVFDSKRQMIYSCNNLDWEYKPKFDNKSKVCVSFACDYKSPTLTLLTRGHPKPVTIELAGQRSTVSTTNTREEKEFSKFFGMDAKVIVLNGVKDLYDHVGKSLTITTVLGSFSFIPPRIAEDSEKAFADFQDACL